jgi:hypothetical protein
MSRPQPNSFSSERKAAFGESRQLNQQPNEFLGRATTQCQLWCSWTAHQLATTDGTHAQEGFPHGLSGTEDPAPSQSLSLPESEQKSCPQAQRGGDARGRRMAYGEGTSLPASENSLLNSDDIQKLAELFLLLDAWDRRRDDSPVM